MRRPACFAATAQDGGWKHGPYHVQLRAADPTAWPSAQSALPNWSDLRPAPESGSRGAYPHLSCSFTTWLLLVPSILLPLRLCSTLRSAIYTGEDTFSQRLPIATSDAGWGHPTSGNLFARSIIHFTTSDCGAGDTVRKNELLTISRVGED